MIRARSGFDPATLLDVAGFFVTRAVEKFINRPLRLDENRIDRPTSRRRRDDQEFARWDETLLVLGEPVLQNRMTAEQMAVDEAASKQGEICGAQSDRSFDGCGAQATRT